MIHLVTIQLLLSILLMLIDSRKSNLTRKHGWATLRVLIKAFIILYIEYLKKLKGKLEESGKTERVATF